MKHFIVIILLLTLLIISGCGSAAKLSGIQTQSNNDKEINGTVNYYELEGGFWGLTAPDGQKYLLLSNDNYTENSEYTITGEPHPERISFQMWGTPFEVASVRISSN